MIGANSFHKIVMVANPIRFYHVNGTFQRMTGYLYKGKDWDPGPERMGLGTVERVGQPSFCEMKTCPEFASWRIRYGAQSVEYCTRHALSSMRSRRAWSRK